MNPRGNNIPNAGRGYRDVEPPVLAVKPRADEQRNRDEKEQPSLTSPRRRQAAVAFSTISARVSRLAAYLARIYASVVAGAASFFPRSFHRSPSSGATPGRDFRRVQFSTGALL